MLSVYAFAKAYTDFIKIYKDLFFDHTMIKFHVKNISLSILLKNFNVVRHIK